MFRVLACISNEHDYRLALLAVVICAATSFTSFHAYSFATQGRGARHLAWVFLTAVCTGAGIWATHFVAMLAYSPGYPTGYDPALTIASLLIAAAVAMAGFWLSSRGDMVSAGAGGAVIGAGISAMHFTGMEALIVPGTLSWDAGLVGASILIGIVLTSAALIVWHGLERGQAGWVAPALLTIAICGLHFTAMGAVTIIPDPTIAVQPTPMNSSTLAAGVTAVTILVMLTLLAMTLITRRGEYESRVRNQELVDAALEGLVVANRGRIVNANRRIQELTRLSPGELLGKRVIGDFLVGIEATASNGAVESSIETATGLVIPVEVVRRPLSGSARADEVYTIRDLTERKRTEQQLRRQNDALQQREDQLNARNEQLDAALENMSQGLAMFDADQRLIVCNRRYAEMYGLAPEQVKPGTTVRQIFQYRLANGFYQVRDTEGFVESWARDFGETSSRIQELANGRIVSVSRRRTASGGRVVTHEDITERQELNARLERQNALLKQQEEKLRTQNLVLDAALNNMMQGLAMYDAEERLVICNKRYVEMYALPPELVTPGTPLQSIIEHCIARGEFPGKTGDELLRSMRERVAAHQAADYISRLCDGRYIAVSVQAMANGGTVTTHYDITERRHSEARIAHMALHDTLTGLPNRVLLGERLERALARVKRGETVATHLLDLDNFKTVNDTLGHAAGDKVLKLVADRLRALVRDTDTIARMGGDEFAIVQLATGQLSDATALAYRAIESVSAPYDIDGNQVVIGISIGIAVGPADGATADQLMRNADLALYRAKDDGRGTYRFFEREMDSQMQVRRSIERDLRKALPAGEFELYYQPMVDLKSNAVSGFEALIRWHHPEKGLIPPATFISLTEENGFIVPLGEWAIREACATAATWPGDLKVAVNLSPVQFRSIGLVEVVVGALAASGLPAERLELEITETTLLNDSVATLSTLYQLRALGVRIAMDDFGTGYSSLSYLQSFPFDRIKIDRSFVKDIADGVGSLNIVRAVTAMATGLGMATTAEGVETQEQLETVRMEGCTEMQGFVFSQPLPADEVENFLRSWSKDGGRAENDGSAIEKAAGAA